MKPILLEALAQVLALIPLAWELYNDRNGEDLEDKRNDLYIRGVLAFISGYLIMLFTSHKFPMGVFAGAALSIGYHFLLFDYLIAVILHKREIINYSHRWRYIKSFDSGYWVRTKFGWFYYLGQKGTVDNIGFWRNSSPWFRLIVRITVFEITLLLYQYFHV